MRTINYLLNVEKFLKNRSLFVHPGTNISGKIDILPGYKIWYLVTIHIDSIQNRLNSLCLTKYTYFMLTVIHPKCHKKANYAKHVYWNCSYAECHNAELY